MYVYCKKQKRLDTQTRTQTRTQTFEKGFANFMCYTAPAWLQILRESRFWGQN